MAACAADRRDGRPTCRARHRPRRPRRDRAAERAGDGDGLRLGRGGRHHGAAQPGLSRGGARVLSRRHRRQGDARRRRRGRPGGRGRRAAGHRPCSGSHATPAAPAGTFRIKARRSDRRSPAASRKPATSRCCCTPPAPRRGPSWCRSATPTWPPRPRNIGATLGADGRRPLPQHHAAVPHPRADRGGAVARSRPAAASTARRASTRCASSTGWATRSRPGTRPCRPCTRRSWRARRAMPEALAARRAALHPLLLGVAAAAGDGRARSDLPLPGDRVLRHDRGRAPDDLEPAAARRAQRRQRRRRRRSGGGDHGAGRRVCCGPARPARW